jgi:hypothetical protein
MTGGLEENFEIHKMQQDDKKKFMQDFWKILYQGYAMNSMIGCYANVSSHTNFKFQNQAIFN